MNCTCPTWRENIDKVNAPNQLLFARNPSTYKGYDGVRFLYCPWCGSLLTPSAPETPAEPLHMVAVEDGEIWVYHEGCACQFCKGEAAYRARSTSTAIKPVCLRDTESHGKGICEICEDGPCADEPINNGIYAETWDERMGRKP